MEIFCRVCGVFSVEKRVRGDASAGGEVFGLMEFRRHGNDSPASAGAWQRGFVAGFFRGGGCAFWAFPAGVKRV